MDEAEGRPRKRPRPTVSCIRCREKKLRCDRIIPCANCLKAACSSECAFSQQTSTQKSAKVAARLTERLDSRHRPPLGIPSDSTEILEHQQNRPARLDGVLTDSHTLDELNASVEVAVPPGWTDARKSTMSTSVHLDTLVVKGSRSRCHGQNDRISLLNGVGFSSSRLAPKSYRIAKI